MRDLLKNHTITNERGFKVIKVCVRAIVPMDNSYLLMGDHDKNGEEFWDLPGGELKPGIDVREHLQRLVLENTGYSIVDLKFFEITCKVRPRKRGQDPATTLDFIFVSKLEATKPQPATKQTELLRFEHFEWLKSDGRYRTNKVMGLLTKFHQKKLRNEESRFHVNMEDT